MSTLQSPHYDLNDEQTYPMHSSPEIFGLLNDNLYPSFTLSEHQSPFSWNPSGIGESSIVADLSPLGMSRNQDHRSSPITIGIILGIYIAAQRGPGGIATGRSRNHQTLSSIILLYYSPFSFLLLLISTSCI